MAKKNATIEEPVQEEAVVETPIVDVEETTQEVTEAPIVEEKPWAGYPSRDFVNPIEGVYNARLETPAEDGGQEQA